MAFSSTWTLTEETRIIKPGVSLVFELAMLKERCASVGQLENENKLQVYLLLCWSCSAVHDHKFLPCPQKLKHDAKCTWVHKFGTLLRIYVSWKQKELGGSLCYRGPNTYGGCPIFLFIETAILREKNINIRETFANPVFFFRGGSPCHETI